MKINASKQKKIQNFDPSAIGVADSNLFGLPFSEDESEVVIIPVPWEVTVSFRTGCALAAEAIMDASLQVDLYDPFAPDAWQAGIFMLPVSKKIYAKNKLLRKKAGECIAHLEKGGSENDAKLKKLYDEINAGGRGLNEWLQKEAEKLLNKGKIVGILGGDHSVPLGFMQALAGRYKKYSVLHIDAHADMRKAYEGFEFSHASIMYNASKIKNIDRIVTVGVRDFSQQEAQRVKDSNGRLMLFDDRTMKNKMFEGAGWQQICKEIVKNFSDNVYVSFDIDGLNPALCPNTGTPVPGGFELEQSLYLIGEIVKSGRKIIGFDLCEVAGGRNSEWDAIIGARLLYRLSTLAAAAK